MPSRNLTPIDNFTTVCPWLDANLQGPIIPVSANLNQVPLEKGLYFWFMRPEGYEALSAYVQITLVEPKYERVIDGVKYHLVYLGTAGTNKKGLSNLRERLGWHIDQSHTPRVICNGILSTLRAGIGSLIADDLILPATEQGVNDIFKLYFQIYWIDYKSDDVEYINSDENNLIRILRPLLNLRNNPNALIDGTSTNIYRHRRNLIYEQTWIGLNCNSDRRGDNERGVATSVTPIPPVNVESDFDNILDGLENEFSKRRIFNIYQNESIHDVVQSLHVYLPGGFCKFILYNPANKEFLYGLRARSTGRGNQNIFTYFNNVDTARDNVVRWVIIQKEMIEKGLNEIMVEVFFDL